MSVPAGVPPSTRSLPAASKAKLPRLMLPSALRVKPPAGGVRVTKSAAEMTLVPPLLSLLLFFQKRFVVPVNVPLVASDEPELNEALFVKVAVLPVRKLKFDWALFTEVLFSTVILPGLLLSVIPW